MTTSPNAKDGIITLVQHGLYDLSRAEARASVKVFRRVPLRERQEVIRRSRRGQGHPDPAVAAAAERWSRAVLRRTWWNRLPGWAQPAACVSLMIFGSWAGAGVIVVPGGAAALALGLLEWNNRRVAHCILEAGTRTAQDQEPEA
ncbi:hypothetical protein [Micromonospora sp. C95]|uniref:hypothetical protein n=1 Tax=Micromonospora sp. C95 TaxID=2824882 RepID=UPI001B379FD1|nr:hypothetical protein [Micromonospora sp. C95]MBQ1023996.1 hypothetical protein [Micromonospora sp. C95]